MSNVNTICRAILEAGEVTNQKITEILVTELVAPGYIKKEEAAALSRKINATVSQQSNALIDRVNQASE